MATPALCLQGVHQIVKFPSGQYICSHCAAAFVEYHALHLQSGVQGQPQAAPILTPAKP